MMHKVTVKYCDCLKLATLLVHERPADHTAQYDLAGPEQHRPPGSAQVAPALHRETASIYPPLPVPIVATSPNSPLASPINLNRT